MWLRHSSNSWLKSALDLILCICAWTIYWYSSHGVTPLPDKVEAVRAFPKPTTIKGLKEFLEMVNYYHRFVPWAANIMQPLFAPTTSKIKIVEWSPEMETAFESVKEALAAATMLMHSQEEAPMAITVDVSSVAVLEQHTHREWKPPGLLQSSTVGPRAEVQNTGS